MLSFRGIDFFLRNRFLFRGCMCVFSIWEINTCHWTLTSTVRSDARLYTDYSLCKVKFISSWIKKDESRGKEMSHYNYVEYRLWWISNLNTHHVPLRQMNHTKRYIKWNHENRWRKTPEKLRNYKGQHYEHKPLWLTILIRRRRTWTSERQKSW